jgi:2-polyprenyl-3-methyl-5-hydroxy-6-metoxy-1,4-benzoquinol methylase
MSVIDFYDRLSPFYHLIYPDWEASVQRQSVQIDGVVREVWGTQARTILDATCGIGTQAIGLSQLGYSVTASDISPRPVQRAKPEAAKRELNIEFGVADLRIRSSSYREPVDLVIACDNSIPHLLSDEEIRVAFREMYRCTSPSGGVLISVRDYDSSETAGTKVVPTV